MNETVIYIDCTNTVVRDKRTGIERVVKNVIERLPKMSQCIGANFLPVIAIGGQFYAVNHKNYHNRRISKLCYKAIECLRNIIDKVLSARCRSDMPVDILEMSPNDVHSQVVTVARRIMPKVFKMAFWADGILKSRIPVAFKSGDVLFIPDSITNTNLYTAVSNTDTFGLRIILFIHDIIALLYDGVYEKSLHKNFKTNYDKITEKACTIICATKTVMHDVIEYNKRYNRKIEYDYSYLGSDFCTLGNKAGFVREPIKKLLSNTSAYLMVGTIEPRKNHFYVLDVFQELWNKGIDVSLCIVGRLGWLYDGIISKISTSQYINNKLFLFTDLNDDELAYCYENSKALIFASISEGFGLPLVEAMRFGKAVLVSDIPVFREVGGEYPFYFSLEKPDSLAGLIGAFENGTLDKQFKPQPWLTWDESIENLLRKVVEVACQPTLKAHA